MHLTSIIMSLFINPVWDQEQRDMIENFALACLGSLLMLNVIFIIWALIAGCKEKKR